MAEMNPRNVEFGGENQQTTFEYTDETSPSSANDTLQVNTNSQETYPAPVSQENSPTPDNLLFPESVAVHRDSMASLNNLAAPENLTLPNNSIQPDNLTSRNNAAEAPENVTAPNSTSPDKSLPLDNLTIPSNSTALENSLFPDNSTFPDSNISMDNLPFPNNSTAPESVESLGSLVCPDNSTSSSNQTHFNPATTERVEDPEMLVSPESRTSMDNSISINNAATLERVETPVSLVAPDNSTSMENSTSLNNSVAPENSPSLINPDSSVTRTVPSLPSLPVTSRTVISTSSVSLTLPMASVRTSPTSPTTATLPTSTPSLSPNLPVSPTPSIIPPSNTMASSTSPYEQASTTTTSEDVEPTCGRCRSLLRSLCSTSPDKYCCIIPAKIWLKFRLCAIVLLLVGLFLVIIFPLPGMVLFQIAIVLLTVSGVFVFIDIGRGTIANCWCETVERPRPQPNRVRTIEVTASARFEEYDNPAFSEGDHPPDYASAIATTPTPLDHGHQRPPNITINIEASERGTTGDLAFDPTLSPSSIFSFSEPYSPRSLPPSYDDVIKEDNDRQRSRNRDDDTPGPSSS
ncbi:mucin-2-like [Lytechinus pictus]|uniref:mucin-2-like n=1 Tax=Lytechinus pictus TaxID=7653 RepID=UPI0030BA1E33